MAVQKKKKSVSWKRHNFNILNKKISVYKYYKLSYKSYSNFFSINNLKKFIFVNL